MRRYIVSLLALLSLVPNVVSAKTFAPKTRAEVLKCEKVQSKYSKKIYLKGDKTIQRIGLNWALCIEEEKTAKAHVKSAAQIQLEQESENMRVYGNPLGLAGLIKFAPKQTVPNQQNPVEKQQNQTYSPAKQETVVIPSQVQNEITPVVQITPVQTPTEQVEEIPQTKRIVEMSGSGAVSSLTAVNGYLKFENKGNVNVFIKKMTVSVEGSQDTAWTLQSPGCPAMGVCNNFRLYAHGESSGVFTFEVNESIEPGSMFTIKTFNKSLSWPAHYTAIRVDSIEFDQATETTGNGLSTFN